MDATPYDEFDFLEEITLDPTFALEIWAENQASPEWAYEHALKVGKITFDRILDWDKETFKRVILVTVRLGTEYYQEVVTVYAGWHNPVEDVEKYVTVKDRVWLLDSSAETIIKLFTCGVIFGGSVIVREILEHFDPFTKERFQDVTAFALREGDIVRLSDSEVFNAFCTDPETQDIIPPEQGVTYMASPILPDYAVRMVKKPLW